MRAKIKPILLELRGLYNQFQCVHAFICHVMYCLVNTTPSIVDRMLPQSSPKIAIECSGQV